MISAPEITIFVRHSAKCPHRNKGEGHLTCNCRKHFRWTMNGKQYRRPAHTRTWKLAQDNAKRLVATLVKSDEPEKLLEPKHRLTVEEAVKTFMVAKRNDGLEAPTVQKIQKVCDRIQGFAEADGIFALEDITLIHLTGWKWSQYFNTTQSLRTNQERVKSFFRYFHNAGVIAKNPAASWKRIKGKVEQVSGFTPQEYGKIVKAAKGNPKLHALVQLMRYAGLSIIDAACLERSQIFQNGDEYRIRLASRQKTSKKDNRQRIDNAVPVAVGAELVAVLNGNPRYVFWNWPGEDAGTDEQKRNAAKFWQKAIRSLLDAAGVPNATSHKFRHTLAIEMIRHGATFEDVAAALGNTVAVVGKFYSHEWSKVRQGRTDAAIKATW
jgi:integrase/recombinase XerD